MEYRPVSVSTNLCQPPVQFSQPDPPRHSQEPSSQFVDRCADRDPAAVDLTRPPRSAHFSKTLTA